MRRLAVLVICLGLAGSLLLGAPSFAWQPPPAPDPLRVLRQENLVAWCIVPFDAKKRGPAERAAMLKELGIRRCAYDWRAEHVPTFEQEILEYRKQGLEFFAFWSVHEEAFKLFEKYKLHPQIWQTLHDPAGTTTEEKVERAARDLTPLAERTRQLGCPLGLYNHGGWGGEPENMAAVCQRLRAAGFDHVGIVYNFHHGHGHIEDWKTSFERIKPLLLCLNINGMNAAAQPKILGLGRGEHELAMLRVVVESGYDGPLGILDHREELDARLALQENLDGLVWLRKELAQPGSGGPRPGGDQPRPEPGKPGASAPDAGQAAAGRVLPGADAYRRPPLTVECQATLHRSDQYNILVASDTKQSADHWELFSMRGSGRLTAYLPGRRPDHVHSEVSICDGKPHAIAMTYEPQRVRLFVDGQLVADQEIAAGGGDPLPGGLGIGRLVEGGIGCDGTIDWVRISRGVRAVARPANAAVERDDDTVGLWILGASDAIERRGSSSTTHTNHGEHASHAPAASSSTAAASGANPPTKDLSYDPELVERLAAEAAQQGDAVRGAQVFAHARSACLSCHRVGGHGGAVGPELTAIAKQREPRQLIEALYWPQREVKPEYVVWQLITTDGKVLSGFKQPSDGDAVVLRDPATGRTTEIARAEIDEQTPGTTPMPAALMAGLSHQQQLDLIRFVCDLRHDGQPLPANIDAALAQASSHGPATFPLESAPLAADRWPQATLPVNSHRVYDFYTKQAEYFRLQETRPMLLAQFPGLDGGQAGHWGYQTEADWADDRWNDMQLGSLQAGIFRADGITVPRGVCVRLGEQDELAACFNPDTLTYDAVWSGGFVDFSPVRHGFMDGLRMQGRLLPREAAGKPNEPFVYRGFYRYGRRVVFAYRRGDVEYLDAPWAEGGKFVREVAPVAEHSLRHVLQGGPAQWPQVLETRIVPGTGSPFAVDTIELPFDNPWQAPLFCGGHDFLPDGSALVCTMQGDVWHVSGLDAPADQPATARWRRFASGLHHALGLVVADGRVYVQCRDQLTRLSDLNNDGEADYYECFSNSFVTSAAGHDFICGLERDAAGHFYTASGNQGLLRISADGQRAEVVADGFRNPDGLGLLPDGTVTVPCSEGEWTPASMICAVRGASRTSPPFFGYRGPRQGQPPELPLVYLPRALDNSSGGQTHVDSQAWGPLDGQLLHFSFGMGSWFLVLRDEVAGQLQGAVVPLAGDFRSGVHRGRFSPRDGQLYVSGMDGWVSFTPDDGCLQRVRYTSQPLQLPVGFHVHQNGVRISFAQPIDRDISQDVRSHFAQVWNYRYSGGYGSAEYSPSHPGVPGHDPLEIVSAHLLPDGRSLFLEMPDLQPVSQLHLRLHVNRDEDYVSCSPAGSGHDLFVTVHKLDDPFTEFPGYAPREKTVAAHPLLADLALSARRVPNPWRQPSPDARPIQLRTGKNLSYETRELRAAAGELLALTLENPDVVPHNWVLARPGCLQTVGELANRLIADPEAYVRQYIPASDDVLAYTDVVGPGETQTIYFRVPPQPGRYPYLCTFPGHWMVMNGVLIVE